MPEILTDRVSTGSLRGEQTLNIAPLVGDDNAHDHGNIPIPPMLDYQLDTVAIKWMRDTMKNMLKVLWEVLKSHSEGSWFDVFLVMFILLNNLEYVYEAQLEYAQQHGAARADRDVSAITAYFPFPAFYPAMVPTQHVQPADVDGVGC